MFDVEKLGLYYGSGISSVAINTMPIMEAPLIERLCTQPLTKGGTLLSRYRVLVWDSRMLGTVRPLEVKDRALTYGESLLKGDTNKSPEQYENFIRFMYSTLSNTKRHLIIAKDVLEDLLRPQPFKQVAWHRNLHELLSALKNGEHRVAFLHHNLTLPDTFKDLMWEMDNPLPTPEEVRDIQERTIKVFLLTAEANKKKVKVEADPQMLTRALQGLTPEGIRDALMYIGKRDEAFNEQGVKEILEIKKRELTRQGVSFAPPPDVPIQGLTYLTQWANNSACLLDKQAREQYNLSKPSNVLLVGAPGTGKSLAVKAIAQQWGVPCLSLDMGKLMTKELGGSEANLRGILQRAEALAPCILWIDEMDKQLVQKGTESDGGTTSRMIGSILTWLEETPHDVVVIGTANRPVFSNEMYRRFKVFLVDLPNKDALVDIWKVQLDRYKLSFPEEQIKTLAGSSVGYTGDDIRKLVLQAATEAFAKGEPTKVKFPPLLEMVRGLKQGRVQGEEFTKELLELRQWAESGMAEWANKTGG